MKDFLITYISRSKRETLPLKESRIMKKAIYLLCIVLLAAAAPLFASGSDEGDSAVTIKYNNFSAGEQNAEVLQAMIAAFEEENPNITVENEAMGYGDNYWTQLVTRIAGNDAPDTFELNMENFLAFFICFDFKRLYLTSKDKTKGI